MQQLDEIVEFYLKTDTNYALMITGKWGTGKTYYFKTVLQEIISKTPTFQNEKKIYNPILVSLFGLKSIKEIQTQIFLSLFPLLKNKTVKLSASIGKALIKGIMQFNGLGEYSNFISDIDVDKGEWIKFSELVICFDDLERLSENIQLEEVIGFINSLVENENVKVLIIANQNKIDKTNYFKLKEKVVGNSIEFIPDLVETFNSLIEKKYSAYSTYKDFLTENKDHILEVFSKKSSNLRILSFALTYFQKVYFSITYNIPSNGTLKEKETVILKKLLKFTLVIAIEYKKGKITFKDNKNLDEGIGPDWPNFSIDGINFGSSDEDKKEKPYKEKLLELYYKDDTYHFFQSVYNFLTGGSIIKADELFLELKTLYHIEKNNILPQYEVYKALSFPNVFNIRDTEYRKLTKQMLNYVDQGAYELTDYLSIFYCSTRFGNPLRLNLEKLEKRIIAGALKGKKSYKFSESLGHYLNVDENSENKEYMLRIKKAALDLNNQINFENKLSDSKRLETLCYKDFKEFYIEVLGKNQPYSHSSIFQTFSPQQFYLYFLGANGDLRWDIVRFWGSRYNDPYFSKFKPELPFLEILKHKIDKKIISLPKSGISFFIFNEFSKELDKSIEKLNSV